MEPFFFMRILYDHQVFSLQNHGGGSVYYYELASRLGGLPGIEVDVCLGLSQSVYPFSSLKGTGTRVIGWDSGIRPGLARYAVNEMLTGAWCAAACRWDIYHSTLYRRMPLVRARRTVATNHDCTQERFPEFFRDNGRVVRAKRKLYQRADRVICVSESSRRDLLEFYDIDRERTCVVHQGVPQLQRCSEKAGEFIERVRRPYLLHVGARYAYKNFDGLLEAYAAGGFAGDFDLVVMGGGEFSPAESEQVKALGIEKNVMHWKYASEAVLAEAYSRAALFVSPSRYEGFGLPPLEALTLGCPVLASNSASVPEICGDCACYFDPTIPGDLERGLRDALNDPEREQRLSRGFQRASQYNWQRNAEGTLAVYESLCK